MIIIVLILLCLLACKELLVYIVRYFIFLYKVFKEILWALKLLFQIYIVIISYFERIFKMQPETSTPVVEKSTSEVPLVEPAVKRDFLPSVNLFYKVVGLILTLNFFGSHTLTCVVMLIQWFKLDNFYYLAIFLYKLFNHHSLEETFKTIGKLTKPEPTYMDYYYQYIDLFEECFGFRNIALIVVISLVLLVVSILVISWLSSAFIRWIKPTARRFRGIQNEAAIPGSDFTANVEIPDFQCPIYKCGLLIPTFVGYAIRYNDFLIMPLHVLTATDDDMLLVTGRGSAKSIYLGSPNFLKSRINNDLCYIRLGNEFSRLSLQTCRLHSVVDERSPLVSITGRSGKSSGLLRMMTSNEHIVYYRGSTLPGYSGAAYHVNDKVYGIHTGASSNENVGVCSVSLLAEMHAMTTNGILPAVSVSEPRKVITISTEDSSELGMAKVLDKVVRPGRTAKQVQDAIHSEVSRAWNYEDEYPSLTYTGHTKDGPSITVHKKNQDYDIIETVAVIETVPGNRTADERIRLLENRVAVLEKLIQDSPVKDQKPVKARVPVVCSHCNVSFPDDKSVDNHMKTISSQKSVSCEHCPKKFLTDSELLNHMKQVSGNRKSTEKSGFPYEPESAIPTDFSGPVKYNRSDRTAFFRRGSRTRKQKNYNSNSMSSTVNDPFTSLHQSQKNMEALMHQMVSTLGGLQKVLAGRE